DRGGLPRPGRHPRVTPLVRGHVAGPVTRRGRGRHRQARYRPRRTADAWRAGPARTNTPLDLRLAGAGFQHGQVPLGVQRCSHSSLRSRAPPACRASRPTAGQGGPTATDIAAERIGPGSGTVRYVTEYRASFDAAVTFSNGGGPSRGGVPGAGSAPGCWRGGAARACLGATPRPAAVRGG